MISAPSVSAILHDQIRPREVSVCWATHDLMEVQKVSRVEWCQKMLCRFQSGHSTTAANIVTSGKNPGSTPTVPKQSAGRLFAFFPGETPPLEVKKCQKENGGNFHLN